jgi:peroxiredoxin (alkyl hydroperoxide reductase subunit C)
MPSFAIEEGGMLTIGDTLPEFKLQACVSIEAGKEFKEISDSDYSGKWKVLFFWPLDFTFVCPTEIAEFGIKNGEFESRNAQLLGCSTDSHFTHLAWRNQHPALKDLPFPMLADLKRELSMDLGILHHEVGACLRATYIIDPDNKIRHVSVNDLSVGRNVDEVVRILDALQTEKLTPCNWKKGEDTLN